MNPLTQWLEEKNIEYREKDIPHKQRPFRAIQDFSDEFRCSFDFSSKESKQIFDWFEKNSPKGTHEAGPMFQGAFFYDSIFWPIYIPIIFGTVSLDAYKSLGTIPTRCIQEIHTNQVYQDCYLSTWADCIDYIINYGAMINDRTMSNLANEMIRSAHKELTASTSLLLNCSPEDKSIESCRMSIEMNLKSIIIQQLNWDEKKIRKEISHNIIKAAQIVSDTIVNQRMEVLSKKYSIFPDINERYKGKKYTLKDLWEGYSVAIGTAAACSRVYGTSDIRAHIKDISQ